MTNSSPHSRAVAYAYGIHTGQAAPPSAIWDMARYSGTPAEWILEEVQSLSKYRKLLEKQSRVVDQAGEAR
jgi:hypothetical protein